MVSDDKAMGNGVSNRQSDPLRRHPVLRNFRIRREAAVGRPAQHAWRTYNSTGILTVAAAAAAATARIRL